MPEFSLSGGEAGLQPARSVSLLQRLRPLVGLALFAFLFLIWSVTAKLLPEKHLYLFPAPWTTARALWSALPELLLSTYYSFLVLIPGYLAAVILGAFSGLLVGSSRWLREIFTPFARVAAPVPPTVYVPYAIALLPSFRSSAIAIVLAAAFWPIFLNSVAGALAVPEGHRDNARVLALSHFEYLRLVALPAALPFIFNGMHVSLGLSFIMLTVAELFGASYGLGRFVQYYADFADYPRMVAGILYTGFVTFLSMTFLGQLEKKIIFWPH
ncbi:MAG: ABC transporter permease [Deltaproteobacteria bacterium]|jgi:NitT/TauT family transport system permease protein|nr:ABC transporter permease [Deltaproteobacteria bacterium]